MPKVPNYDNFSVDINAAPGDRYQAGQASQPLATPPGGFQPGVIQPIQINNVPALSEGLATIGGRQMAAAGDALQRAGTSMAQVAFDAQRQMNELRVDDSLNKTKEIAMRMQFDKDKGFMSQAGWDALHRESGKPLYQEFGEKLRDQVNTIADGMGNEAQKQAYMMRANDMVTQFEGQAQSHMLQQAKIYSVSVAKGTIENQMNEIGLNYNNPEKINEAINGRYGVLDGKVVLSQKGIVQAVKEYGIANGMAAEEIEALTRQKISNAHTIAIDSFLANGNVAGANSYLNNAVRAKQMDADDILKVQKVLTADINTKTGMAAAQTTMSLINPRMDTSDMGRMFNITAMSESGNREFDAKGNVLTSSEGAKGSMQVLDGTNKDPGYGVKPAQDDSLAERRRVGQDYLSAMLKEFGDPAKAWAAYNAGPGKLQAAIKTAAKEGGTYLDYLPKETQDYVAKNVKAYEAGSGQYQKPTLQDALALTRQNLGPNASAKAISIAEEQTIRYFEVNEKAVKQREAETVGEAQRILYQTKGDWTQLPSYIQARIPPGQLDDLKNFGKSMSSGMENTNYATYNIYANNPDKLAKLSDAEWMRMKPEFSQEDYDKLSKTRAEATGAAKGSGTVNDAAIDQYLNLTMSTVNGTNPSDTSNKVITGVMRKLVTDEIQKRQNATGSQYNDKEIAKVIDEMAAKHAIQSGMVWGNSSDKKSLFAFTASDVPPAAKDEIIKRFTSKGLAKPEATMILSIYLKDQLALN